MFLLTVALLAAACCLAYLKLCAYYNYWARRGVPHETPALLVGNMKGLGRLYHFREINQRIYERFKQTAAFVGYYSFLSRAVMLIDLDLVKQVMTKDFNVFPNRGLFHNVRDDPLTGNLLFLDGEQWRRLRRKLSPVFTSGKMRYMCPTLFEIGDRFVSAINTALKQTGSSDIEVTDLCARYTTDVIGVVAFGLECNSLNDPQAPFRHMGQSIFNEPRHSLPVTAFMFSNPDLARKMRLKNFSDGASEFFMNAVRQTVEYRERNGIKRNDFMDMLIELKAQRDALGNKADGDNINNGLTLEQVAAQAMVFFLAGFHTSSITLYYALYELAMNPHIQEELRISINTISARHNNKVEYEHLKEFMYLDQVICETLRKHPVIPHLVRVSTADYKVPGSNQIIEHGTRVFIPVYSIHNDPDIYSEPEVFDPNRFTSENMNARHSHAFLPFGDGPRNCIGSSFARMQTKVGLISLLRHFRFSRGPRTEVPLKLAKKNFFNEVENGIYLNVEPLQKSD